MKISRTGFFTARLCRFFSLLAFVAAATLASQGASAAISGDALYNSKVIVPGFVPDVRALIVDAVSRRGWTLVDDKPGELTFELKHAKSHLAVVVKAYYSNSEFWFEKVSAKSFQCKANLPCDVHRDSLQRWLISLRREAGVALLRLAIKDAGGSVPAERAPVVEQE